MDTIGMWQWARRKPADTALVTPEHERVSFAELAARANRLAHGLRARGLVEGDMVAVLLPNSPAWVETFMATQQIGLYMTAINYHLTAPEVAYILENSGSRLFISNPRHGAVAREAAARAGLAGSACFAEGGSIQGFAGYETLLKGQPENEPEGRRAGELMLYTSGTTGRPKGVRRPLKGVAPEEPLVRARDMARRMYGLTPGDGCHLVQGPLYHAAPGRIGMRALHLGHTLVLMDKWTPEGALARVERYRVDNTHMVPTMFHRLLKLPRGGRERHDLSSMRVVLHGAAPCPVETKRKMMRWWGPVLYEYYGGTEGGGTYVTPEDWLARPGTVGRPWPGSQVFVLDAEGNELPAGRVGVVYFLPSQGPVAYHRDPDKTRAAFRGELLTLGDMGYVDEDGWLFLSDRRSDLILSGGVNIYPAEIEAVLHQHAKVADVVVFGLPDEEWGERVQAVVQPLEDVASSPELADELLRFAAESLARYKLPKQIDFVDELPRLPTGKLARREVRERYLPV
ncbi:MAG TPA: AMP-binding protein [Gammaproteobacteria bacterium]|nr:AMP-binding protein [Gammaproteobacteria bacterium]